MEKSTSVLRLISGKEIINIRPTDGTKTFIFSKNMFWAKINFQLYEVMHGLGRIGPKTKKTQVEVYEMIKDATVAEMFGSFNSNLEKTLLTQHQIIQFIEDYKKWFLEEQATHFLFKSNGKLIVACVCIAPDNVIGVELDDFENTEIWKSQHKEYRRRVVVPKFFLL